nr:MAG TPA: hypothetical protein [Caudoviricetes sp.]
MFNSHNSHYFRVIYYLYRTCNAHVKIYFTRSHYDF